jgi:molybdenum cofactor cytidylyltransferase
MIESKDVSVGGLLLAAGGSTRFGRPKQLAEYQGITLLKRSAEAIVGSGCSTVVVVLGSHADESAAEIKNLHLHIAVNEEWETGMSSSIKSGLAKLLDLDPAIDAVLITLMDQPRITASHLARFLETFAASRPSVIAAKYSGITGVPALFSREIFDELFLLEADRGARSIIRGLEGSATIELAEAAVDIDVLSDLKRLT